MPESHDCETITLSSEETETFQLDFQSLLREVGLALRLNTVAVERLNGPPSLFCIGHIGDTLTPCFFSVASTPGDTSRAAASVALSHTGPVIVFVTLSLNIPDALRSTMRQKGGGCFGFDEILDLDARGTLVATKSLGALASGRFGNTTPATPRLIVPHDTPWSDIRLKLINGKTLIATYRNKTVRATAEQLGQVPRDNPEEFLLGWKAFVTLAAKRILTGDESGLFPNTNDFKNRRKEIRNLLRDFVSINADPLLDLSKRPKDKAEIRKGDRAHRKLRKGVTLIPPLEFVTGVDGRIGQLEDLARADSDDADSADSYPRRSRQNSDED